MTSIFLFTTSFFIVSLNCFILGIVTTVVVMQYFLRRKERIIRALTRLLQDEYEFKHSPGR